MEPMIEHGGFECPEMIEEFIEGWWLFIHFRDADYVVLAGYTPNDVLAFAIDDLITNWNIRIDSTYTLVEASPAHNPGL